jgi:hypothetical protein
MRLIFSTPGQPRGRGRIERFFATVNQMFLYMLPGYMAAAFAVIGTIPQRQPRQPEASIALDPAFCRAQRQRRVTRHLK